MKKIFLLLPILVIIIALNVNAQAPDNDFQTHFAKVASVIQKNTESLTKADVDLLKETEQMSIMKFGEAYQNSMRTLIQNSKKKLREYNEYIVRKKESETQFQQKERELQQSESMLKMTESERDIVIQLNEQLIVEIENLNKRIKKLTGEKITIEKSNKKLLEDAQNYEVLLSDTRRIISRMQNLLVSKPLSNELAGQIPATLKDSIENIECGVSETLMNNFNLTLKAMLKDEEFMDSVSKYFVETKSLPEDINDYISSGIELSEKMSNGTTDCVRISGTSILNAIEDFKLEVENYSKKKSLDEILLIPGLILILILIVVIIIIMRRKRK